MAKDPAVLLYNDKWSASTAGMKSEYRAWYMDLIIYQFGNGAIPEDQDTLAGICHVLPSEYARFITFCEQIIPQKFIKTEDGYMNSVAGEIIKKRENFIDKRIRSGIIGSIIKKIKKDSELTDNELNEVVEYLNNCTTEELNELKCEANVKQVLKQVLKQMDKQVLKHYINVNVDATEDVNINYKSEKGGTGGKTKRFSKPDPGDVHAFFIDAGYTVGEADYFFDHYESNGWRVGQHPMKDWKATARNWFKRKDMDVGRLVYSPPRHQPEISKHDKFFAEMAEIGEKIISEHNQKLNRNGQPLELAQ